MARSRRARLARLVEAGLREEFDRNGTVVVRDMLPPSEFETLRTAILEAGLTSREQLQGDTVTRRVPVGRHQRESGDLVVSGGKKSRRRGFWDGRRAPII